MAKLNYEEQIKKIGRAKTVLTFLCIVCIAIIALLLTELKTSIDENKMATEIPTAGLSKSVFDLQNSEYVGLKDDMETAGYLYNGHYAYDMYKDIKYAKEGSSSFYHINDGCIVGVTIVESADLKVTEENVLEVLSKDMAAAFGTSKLAIKLKEEGYRNGFSVKYYYFESTEGDVRYKGVVYVATCDEGYIAISGFGEGILKDVSKQCLGIYKTLHVPNEWKRNNELETVPSFINESGTAEVY